MSRYNSTKSGRRGTLKFACFVLCAVTILASTASGQEADKKPTNFYAITGNGLRDTSWIFGTYHLVKSSYLDAVPAVLQAFQRSKGVAVELVIDSSKTARVATMGLMKDKTLSELLDKSFQDTLDNELKTTLGVGMAQFNQLKPINVALTLSMVYLLYDPASLLRQYSGSMLDGYFAESARQDGKTITELETIEEQMNLLFNTSTNEEQVNQLKYFLRNKRDMVNQGNDLLANWFAHDLNKMYAITVKGLAVFGNEADYLNKRNDRWMKVLPGLIKKESQFIAVGALHLAGPRGLVKQFEEIGYTLTPIKL